MQWPEKLDVLFDIYAARVGTAGNEALNAVEITLICIRWFQVEMTNGSFGAFFYNSAGAYAYETVDALTRIGATISASLLSRAIGIYFHDQVIPRDQGKRRELLKEVNGDATPAADIVDHEYWEADEPLEDLLLCYIRSHEAELRIMRDEAVTAVMLDQNWRQCTKCREAWEQPLGDTLARCPACLALTLVRESSPQT